MEEALKVDVIMSDSSFNRFEPMTFGFQVGTKWIKNVEAFGP